MRETWTQVKELPKVIYNGPPHREVTACRGSGPTGYRQAMLNYQSGDVDGQGVLPTWKGTQQTDDD